MLTAGASQKVQPYSFISRYIARPTWQSRSVFQLWARAAAAGKAVVYW